MHDIRGPEFPRHCRFKERRCDVKQLIASGGIPSSHSATVAALTTAIGFQDGLGGSVFAIAVIFACIVCSSLALP